MHRGADTSFGPKSGVELCCFNSGNAMVDVHHLVSVVNVVVGCNDGHAALAVVGSDDATVETVAAVGCDV